MEAINESLAELAAKVEDLTSTPAPRKKIGFDQKTSSITSDAIRHQK
jgi:hypothetical protein